MYLSYEGSAEGLEDSSSEGKRPQKWFRTQALSVSCPSLNAGGGWETGRVTRYTDAIVNQGALNRKKELQKPSPVCSYEKAPVRMCISTLKQLGFHPCAREHGPL